MHGGSAQALQAMTTNPLSNPPTDLTLIADLDNPPFPYRLLHANMQSWHPTHLWTSPIVNRFI
jgi:hypothetical protein